MSWIIWNFFLQSWHTPFASELCYCLIYCHKHPKLFTWLQKIIFLEISKFVLFTGFQHSRWPIFYWFPASKCSLGLNFNNLSYNDCTKKLGHFINYNFLFYIMWNGQTLMVELLLKWLFKLNLDLQQQGKFDQQV